MGPESAKTIVSAQTLIISIEMEFKTKHILTCLNLQWFKHVKLMIFLAVIYLPERLELPFFLPKINMRFNDQNRGTRFVRDSDKVLFRVTGL